MSKYIIDINIDKTVAIIEVGGKGANLIELSKLKNIHVPKGFCLTTSAFKEALESNVKIKYLIDKLNQLTLTDKKSIAKLSIDIRQEIENIEISDSLKTEISEKITSYGSEKAYAVRSSATAEDMPTASFAGQHDTYLNVIGIESILNNTRKCWASLFTERAVIYRIQNSFEHQNVQLSVVVQEMILPEASGIMFTADPNTSNRKIVSIDASYGLGEALVSGMVNADNYQVRDGLIVKKIISKKEMAILPLSQGGTTEKIIDDKSKKEQAISDERILELEKVGRAIESHFTCPQDIEWCIQDGKLHIVQSRPITTLYPLPESTDGQNHVLMSSGHLQMMTSAVKPLGLTFLMMQLGDAPYQVIGGHLYNDLTGDLSTPMGRLIAKSLLGSIGDKLMTDSIVKVIKNKKLLKSLSKGMEKTFKVDKTPNGLKVMVNMFKQYRENDPNVIKQFVEREEKSIRKMENDIKGLSGTELMEFIYDDHTDRRFKLVDDDNAAALGLPPLVSLWFNRVIKKNCGITNAADTIMKSIPNSITSEYGFALLDVSDEVRKYPEVLEYFNKAEDSTFYDDLSKLDGGKEVAASIKNYLDLYGVRCSGDIDITIPRWSEEPTKLIPLILNNIKNFEPNSKQEIHEEGIIDYRNKVDQWCKKIESKPGGKRKAKKIRKAAKVIRNGLGYREYPKFSFLKRYLTYKKAMLNEADKLVADGQIKDREDIFYLYLEELIEAVKNRKVDYDLISKRRNLYKTYDKLTPQRVITSDGDVIVGEYDKKDIPSDALIGVPVSAGVIEGRARVIHSMSEADFEKGDILVTEFTDPSWTPIFVSIQGLITEVGGTATHGAVISREYGLPAIVSVENATKLIKDGQRIRLDGSKGFVEILSD